jgi:predicted chitinase
MIKQALFLLAIVVAASYAQYVSQAQFQCMFPNVQVSKIQSWLPHLNSVLSKYDITSTNRITMFMAQTGHETDHYKTFVEYTNSDGTNAWCHKYDGGCRFKGRGAIQLTHRRNYASAGSALGYDYVNNPDMVAELPHAFLTAGWFWSQNGLNNPSDLRDLDRATRIINGGTNGLEARRTLYNRAKMCFSNNPNEASGCVKIQHRVVTGETLYGIAQRYGKQIDKILAINPQITNPAMIRAGDVINIPCDL